MGVGKVGLSIDRGGQQLSSLGFRDRRPEGAAQPRHGVRWGIGLGGDLLKDTRPMASIEIAIGSFESGQRAPGGLGAGHLGGASIGLVLIGPGEHERIRLEVGRIPAEESGEQELAKRRFLLLESFQEATPGPPHSIDPAGEAAVIPRQVSQLMTDDGPDLVDGEAPKERQPEDEEVVLPTENPQLGDLDDRGVELVGDEQVMNARRIELTAHLVDGAPEVGRQAPVDQVTGRRLQPYPESLGDGPRDEQQRERQLEEETGDPLGQGNEHHQRQQEEDHEQHHEDVGVAQRGESAHLATIPRRVRRGFGLEPLDEGAELSLRHQGDG